tara:strand:+ start:2547 stop:3923 length:1377 start_codon:yes stop_codon:yes gene_type:complete
MEELDPNILKLLKKFKDKPRLERSVNSLVTKRINKNKIPKYEDKTKYFSDNIDFDKAPTQEEYKNYRKFFERNSKSNVNIKESNRLKLALRYRDFFNKEGIEKSESIERYDFSKYKNLSFNLGKLKNNTLIKRFSEERNKKLVKLINENVNFDTYSSESTVSYNNRIFPKIDNFINIRNKIKPKNSLSNKKYYSYRSEQHENKYQVQSNNLEGYYGYDKFYDKYYPENIYRTVLDTKDKDYIKVNDLDKSREKYNDNKYSYHARDFNRYNLEEQLNFGLSSPVIYDEKGKHTGMSAMGTYIINSKTIALGRHYGQNRDNNSSYFQPSTPISAVKGLLMHEGLHASEYPYGKFKSIPPGGATFGFSVESPTNPTHLSGLDAVLGLTYKTKFSTRGPNPYQNQNMEFGAWFEQKMLRSKESGKFDSSILFSGINFEEESKKEDPGLAKRNRINFLKSILE